MQNGFLQGADFVQQYDPIKNPRQSWWPKSWLRDHDLESAVQNSVVWYFQEVARQIGPEEMSNYLSSTKYGNQDASGGIDRFWLGNSLKISPEGQARFLQRLFGYEFFFDRQHIDLVKRLILLERGAEYVIRGKTGACQGSSGVYVGWLIGLVERNGRTYYFATLIEASKFSEVIKNRMQVTKSFLRQFDVL